MQQAIEFNLTIKKKTNFTLHLFIPSWAKNTKVYVNGKKYKGALTPASYVDLNRTWKNQDKIKLVFDYGFHIKTMPDDKHMIALFYGPTLLAFENSSELILKADSKDDILDGLKCINQNEYSLQNNGKTYSLKPFYLIENESYGVYATIRNQ